MKGIFIALLILFTFMSFARSKGEITSNLYEEVIKLEKEIKIVDLLFVDNKICVKSIHFVLNEPKAKLGTFQIIVENSKSKFIYTDDFLVLVEKNRKQSEDFTLVLDSYSKVFIPSYEKIASKEFIPLEEFKYLFN